MRVRRLLFVALVALLACVAVIGGSAAGAASAPAPAPSAPLPLSEAAPVDNGEPPANPPSPSDQSPRRHGLVGVVVGVGPARMAVAVKSQDRPLMIGIRPATEIRVDRRKATLDELHPGDVVLVVGRPGPRGNMVARAVIGLRRADSLPAI